MNIRFKYYKFFSYEFFLFTVAKLIKKTIIGTLYKIKIENEANTDVRQCRKWQPTLLAGVYAMQAR